MNVVGLAGGIFRFDTYVKCFEIMIQSDGRWRLVAFRIANSAQTALTNLQFGWRLVKGRITAAFLGHFQKGAAIMYTKVRRSFFLRGKTAICLS